MVDPKELEDPDGQQQSNQAALSSLHKLERCRLLSAQRLKYRMWLLPQKVRAVVNGLLSRRSWSVAALLEVQNQELIGLSGNYVKVFQLVLHSPLMSGVMLEKSVFYS